MNVDKSAIIGLLEAAMAADYTAVRRLGDAAEADAEGRGDIGRITKIIRGAEEP